MIINNHTKKNKIKNRTKLIKDFLSKKNIKENNTVVCKNSTITRLKSSEQKTNYYKLQSKKDNHSFFIKEITDANLIRQGNQGYNEYMALKNEEFKKDAKLFDFEVIEPYVGYVDYKENKSYIVTPYKELKTIDQLYDKKLISRNKYIEYRTKLVELEKYANKNGLKIGDILTHNVFLDINDKKQKPIIFDPWCIPQKKYEM
jgi:hypothetical protein